MSRHTTDDTDLDTEVVTDDDSDPGHTFELGQVIPATLAKVATGLGFRLTPSWKGAAEEAMGVPSAYLVIESPEGRRIGDDEADARIASMSTSPSATPEDDEDDDGEEVEPEDGAESSTPPAGSAPVRFYVAKDGGEWGVKDRSGGDRFVRLGRNTGVSSTRWDTQDEANEACRRLNEASPETVSEWARWGMP